MAKRGEVLVGRRRLGFAGEGRAEHFVVVQSDQLRDLETAIVAPLDLDGEMYEGDPLVVQISAREAGGQTAARGFGLHDLGSLARALRAGACQQALGGVDGEDRRGAPDRARTRLNGLIRTVEAPEAPMAPKQVTSP